MSPSPPYNPADPKNKQRSYAATASSGPSSASTSSAAKGPPKAPRKPAADLLNPAPSANFYGASSAPRPPPPLKIATSMQPKPNPKPNPKKKAASKAQTYVEIDDDEDEIQDASSGDADDDGDDDDMSISTAKSAPRPKSREPKSTAVQLEGDALLPRRRSSSGPRNLDAKENAWIDTDMSSTARSSAMARSSSSRSQASRRGANNNSTWDPDSDDEVYDRSRRSNLHSDSPEGPAMTVTKILAHEGEDGGHAGIWSTPVLDFSFSSPEEVNKVAQKDMIKPLGTFIPTSQEEIELARADAAAAADAATQNKGIDPGEVDELMEEEDVDDVKVSTPAPTAAALGGCSTITAEELGQARPHPNAYFSPETFSWAILVPTTFKDDLSVARSDRFECWRYAPLRIPLNELDPPPHDVYEPAKPDELKDEEQRTPPTGLRRLCSTNGYVIAHSTLDGYPTVIPPGLWQRFVDRDPSPSQTREAASMEAARTLYRVLTNLLFAGQRKALSINSKTFSKAISWDNAAHDVFIGHLGFGISGDGHLTAPKVDGRIPEQLESRQRLLRAWLEVGLWVENFRMKAASGKPTVPSLIVIEKARPMLVKSLGGDTLPRRSEKNSGWSNTGTSALDPAADEYHTLGVTPTLADEVIAAMYLDQVDFFPIEGPTYLTCLQTISNIRNSETLKIAVGVAKSQGHWTHAELLEAYQAIGCTGDNPGVLPDDSIEAAFTDVLGDSSRRAKLRESCLLIARSRNSDMLKMLVESVEEEKPKMTLTKAYSMLADAGQDDPSLLIAVYGIRMDDSPGQADSLKEALGVIGEHLKSPEIRNFLSTGGTGSGGWEASPATSPDRPVGLTNIANTCYLNSLLQYFFTVRELRETILHYSASDLRALSGEDELPRVGVVFLLQGLFNQLIHAPTSAVTPETELAYLALVPSKEEPAAAEPQVDDAIVVDEIVVDPEPAAPSTSAMDASPAPEVGSPASTTSDEAKSPSVLGKRTSEHLDGTSSDSDVDGMVIDSQPTAPAVRAPLGDRDTNRNEITPPPSKSTEPRRSTSVHGHTAGAPSFDENLATSLSAKEAPDGVVEIGSPDVEMAAPGPPPLPLRLPKGKEKGKEPEKTELEKQVSAYMSFGKQNDVTECMDNVMFQLECALNPTSSDTDGGDAASLVKRTFYGKMKQQLEIINDPTEKEPLRIKEDPFFSLLVGVDLAEQGRNVYDGLDSVFDDALVEIEGKHARRRITLVDVPPILHIQLQRVQYDRIAKKIFKSNAHLSFDDTITLDRYLEIDPTDEVAVARRDRTANCRQELELARTRLQALAPAKGTDSAKILRTVQSHLVGKKILAEDNPIAVSADAALAASLLEADDLEAEIAKLRNRIDELRSEIESIWIDQQSTTFELVSVFIHRGSASSGHYYIYQRDSKKPERWLKYNDSLVTDVDPKEEVFREPTGDANAYFLVYCRRDKLYENFP
ncbi:hypothetical protein RQP46_004915 [Phenoliferia psychrophenolica]